VLRALAAAGVSLIAVIFIPGTPSEPAIIVGCVLWWLLTSRSDLARTLARVSGIS
jgi:hypothetical protein